MHTHIFSHIHMRICIHVNTHTTHIYMQKIIRWYMKATFNNNVDL